jgi:hypothetical protein
LKRFSDVLAHYMLQSEQLDTTLVLAANDQVAAGLLIQRLPMGGIGNLGGSKTMADEDGIGQSEDYNRIAILANSLTSEELLSLSPEKVLHRLFWQEQVRHFTPQPGDASPRFVCSCNRERVSQMIRSLGQAEADSILAERENIEVGCDFCGLQYRFDAVDAGHFKGGQPFAQSRFQGLLPAWRDVQFVPQRLQILQAMFVEPRGESLVGAQLFLKGFQSLLPRLQLHQLVRLLVAFFLRLTPVVFHFLGHVFQCLQLRLAL